MKMSEAMRLINSPKDLGYRVHFEWKKEGMLKSDYFPAREEESIKDREAAWLLAKEFAIAMKGDVVNLYVCTDDFSPVADYKAKMIKNRN